MFVPPGLNEMDLTHNLCELAELRRSTRQKAPPDRFVGCSFTNGKRHSKKSSRTRLPEIDILACLADVDVSEHTNYPKEIVKGKMISHDESDEKFLWTQRKIQLKRWNNFFHSMRHESSSLAIGDTGKFKLAENHKKVRYRHERKLEDGGLCKEDPHSIDLQKPNKRICWNQDSLSDKEYLTCLKNSCKKEMLTPKVSSGCPPLAMSEMVLVDEVQGLNELHHNIVLRTWREKIGESSSKHQSSCKIETKKDIHMNLQSGKGYSSYRVKKGVSHKKLQSENVSLLEWLKQRGSDEKLRQGKGSSMAGQISYSLALRKPQDEGRRYRNRFFTTGEYKQMVERCMKNIEHEIGRQQPLVVAQWEAKQAVNNVNTMLEFNWPSDVDDHVEIKEHEDLWTEMENALTGLPIIACQVHRISKIWLSFCVMLKGVF